jgi:hypothetical protein
VSTRHEPEQLPFMNDIYPFGLFFLVADRLGFVFTKELWSISFVDDISIYPFFALFFFFFCSWEIELEKKPFDI